MTEYKGFKGTWAQRFFIIVLSLVLTVLLYWLLGFITRDIGSLRGPERSKVEAKYVDAKLVERHKSLEESLDDIKENIKNKQEQQAILKDSTDSLQNTINQLLSVQVQKQNIEKGSRFPPDIQKTFLESQTLFLENQKQHQALNEDIAELTKQKRQLEKELHLISGEMKGQQAVAQAEYNHLMSRHRLKVAALKLAVVVPIFLILAWVFAKKRSGTYQPIVYAAFIAVFIRISLIVHEYFPRKYFKYIALLVVIGIVLKLIVYLLKRIISPKKDLMVKQYREAYDKGVCPICGKPIRIGPLRYAVGGTRHKGLVLLGQGAEAVKQEVYTCPSCGTELYGKCDKCKDICHSLLPFCEHCGNEKADSS